MNYKKVIYIEYKKTNDGKEIPVIVESYYVKEEN